MTRWYWPLWLGLLLLLQIEIAIAIGIVVAIALLASVDGVSLANTIASAAESAKHGRHAIQFVLPALAFGLVQLSASDLA